MSRIPCVSLECGELRECCAHGYCLVCQCEACELEEKTGMQVVEEFAGFREWE